MKALWLIPAIVMWTLCLVLLLPFQIGGFVLVPLMAALGRMKLRPSQKIPGVLVLAFSDPWMWIYCNEQDGIDGTAQSFWPKAVGWARVWEIIKWSALRNSTGNARWLPFFGVDNLPNDEIQVIWGQPSPTATAPTPTSYFLRQGIYFMLCFPWGKSGRVFRIGWRINATFISPNPAGWPGMGVCFEPGL